MEKELELLKTFPVVSKEAWKQQAIADLKGADFDRKLVWRTYEGIPVQPFYTQEDTENKQLPSDVLSFPSTKRAWVNYVEIKVEDVTEANRLARKMVQFDAGGILFDILHPGTTDLGQLLQGLSLETLNISFKTEQPDAGFIKAYFDYCEKQGVAVDKITGFYECDTLEEFITKGSTPDFKAFAEVVEATAKVPGFYGITVKSHAFADSGANVAQEIAYTFNKLVEYLAALTENTSLTAEELLGNVFLNTAIGGDYFFEISKVRAMRLLFQTIAQCYGVQDATVKILSSSGLWSKSIFDPNVNMLRNTTEAMSSVIGGCDALLIQPHDSSFQTPTDFSHRIALNLSNLLKEESYLDKVVDPSAGSYYIENLTQDLSKKSLELFKEVEEAGGFVKAFEAGAITAAIAGSKKQKEGDITSRRKVYVGVNKYPNLKEKTSVKDIEETTAEGNLLQPQRATQAFDTLRLTTLNHLEETGYIPKVYLACFGNLAMRKARATFATEFYGIAGFEILGEFVSETLGQAAVEAAKSEGDIVVMCSSDPDYETDAEAFAKLFKQNAPDKHLVLAGWPEGIVETLKEAGVDSFIHLKVNAIDALSDLQKMLFQSSKIL